MARARSKKKTPRIKLAMRTARDYQSCAERLKALADPDRLRIVNCLLRGPKNVSEVAKELDETIVKVSHHLRVLRHAHVVETRKRGKFVIYSLDPAIADGQAAVPDMKTLDLGCCRLDLAQIHSR